MTMNLSHLISTTGRFRLCRFCGDRLTVHRWRFISVHECSGYFAPSGAYALIDVKSRAGGRWFAPCDRTAAVPVTPYTPRTFT